VSAARLYKFPPLRIAKCAKCRGHFQAVAASHRLCSTCYYWNLALSRLAAAASAFSELRARERA
jgi:hypothetical protein